MRFIFTAAILISFALVSADDNPYGVSAPASSDTSAKKVKAPAPVKDTVVVQKKTAVKDTVVAAKPADTTVVKSKKKNVKPAKVVSQKDSISSSVAKVQPVPADTTAKVKKDSSQIAKVVPVKSPDTTLAKSDTSTANIDTTTHKPRPRIVRETTINTLNEMKGKYRSPKQALFMSLVVPGLGQAYVGQTTFNYVRAAVYFSTDILLGALWYDYVVVKHNREVRSYHHFADAHWSQVQYEDSITQHADANFAFFNPSRQTYCNSVVPAASGLAIGCNDPVNQSAAYQGEFLPYVHSGDYSNLPPDQAADSTAAYRAKFTDAFEFYSINGQEQEFITGWSDATGVGYVGAGDSSYITGTSAYRDQYIAMRAQANKYARMQAWFLGGIVLNHIASALDAALSATYHNRELYQTDAMWYDRLHFDGGMAFDQGWPKTNITAYITF